MTSHTQYQHTCTHHTHIPRSTIDHHCRYPSIRCHLHSPWTGQQTRSCGGCRPTRKLPLLHMDDSLLLQHGHSNWKSRRGSLFDRNELTRQYVTPHSISTLNQPYLTIYTADPKIRRSLVAVAVINIVLNIPQVLLAWFQCKPPNALWDPERQDLCNHTTSVHYTYFVGAIAALSDFYLAIIPATMLAPLKIDRKLKWGLSFLMGCGVFAGVAAIVRTWAAKFIMSDDPPCKYHSLRQKPIPAQSNIQFKTASASSSAGAK